MAKCIDDVAFANFCASFVRILVTSTKLSRQTHSINLLLLSRLETQGQGQGLDVQGQGQGVKLQGQGQGRGLEFQG